MKLLWAFCLSFFVLLAKAQTEVHVYLLEACPMAQFYGPTFRKLQHDFPSVRWTFVFPNSNDSLAAAQYLSKYQLSHAAILLEPAALEIWNADQPFAVSPSVVVWRNQEIVYRGAIDDAFVSPGKRRIIFQNHYLQTVLEKSSTKPINEVKPVGCLLSLPKT
jgi:hypothetical protein